MKKIKRKIKYWYTWEMEQFSEAFSESPYDVYIASQYVTEKTKGNIHIAKRWNF